MRTDWMPGTRAGQLLMARRWIDVFTEKGVDWGITQEMRNQLLLLTANADDAQARANSAEGC